MSLRVGFAASRAAVRQVRKVEGVSRLISAVLIGNFAIPNYNSRMHGETTLAILRRVIDFSPGELPAALAEAVLQIQFAESDRARMGELASKCNQGVLATQEAEEYDSYIAAADLLSLWKSKARLALKPHSSAA